MTGIVPWSRMALGFVAAVVVGCAPAAPPSPTAVPPKPAATTAPVATAVPAAKPAEVKPAAEKPAAKAVDLNSARSVAEVVAAVKGLSPTDREKALLEKANKEGEIVWYTSWQPDGVTNHAKEFSKKYPSIKANFLRKSGGELQETVLAEGKAGRQLWDVYGVNAEHLYAVQQANLITDWNSPLLAEIPEGLKDPKGSWAVTHSQATTITWNTNKVNRAEAPKTYQDLLDPKWKGKFSLDNEDFVWFQYILDTMGKEQGLEYHKKLKANSPIMMTGSTNQLEQLIAGEFSMGSALLERAVVNAKSRGAPVDYIYPQPVLLRWDPMVLAKTAPHPAAAVLFMDWLFTVEAQQALTDSMGHFAAHPQVKPRFPEVLEARKGMKFVSPDPLRIGQELPSIQAQFREIYLK